MGYLQIQLTPQEETVDQLEHKTLLTIGLVLFMLVLTGCPSEDKAYSIAEDHYLIGFILHNVDDSTNEILNYSVDDLAVYNYSYNYPGGLPRTYSQVLFWVAPIHENSSAGAGSSWIDINVPVSKTYYLYGENPVPQSYRSNWSFSNYLHVNYLKSEESSVEFAYEVMQVEHYLSESAFYGITPIPGVYKQISFGGAPYLPTSITINDSNLLLNSHLLRGSNGNSYISRRTKQDVWNSETGEINVSLLEPNFQIYKEGSLDEFGNLTDEGYNWDKTKLNYDLTNGNYTVIVNFSSYYPVWNHTMITSSFEYPSIDPEPPVLTQINISPRFQYNENINVSLNFTDDSTISNVSIFYSTDLDDTWVETNVDENYTTNFSIPNGGEEEINLKFEAIDFYNNSINWVVKPVSLLSILPIFDFDCEESSATRGELISCSGQCITDLGGNCSGLRFAYYLNDQFVSYDRSEKYDSWAGTEEGEFSTEITIPYTITGDSLNISLIFPGTGIFQDVTETVEIDLVMHEYDLAVNNLTCLSPEIDAINDITAEVFNNGDYESTQVNVSLIIDQVLVNSTIISTVSSLESESVSFNWSPTESGIYNITIYVTPEDDDGDLTNNYAETEVSLGADIKGYISLSSWSNAINESVEINIDYGNNKDINVTDISAVFFDFYDYDSTYPDYGKQGNLYLNDTLYYVNATLRGNLVDFNITYNDTSYYYTLHEGQSILLNTGARFDFKYKYSDYCALMIGFAEKTEFELENLTSYDEKEKKFNWTPTVLGYHRLKLFINTSSDSYWANNNDYTGGYVKSYNPDLIVMVDSNYYLEYNAPSNLEIDIYNDGYVDSGQISGLFTIYYPYVDEYISYESTDIIEFNGNNYSIYVNGSSNLVFYNVTYDGTSELFNLTYGENITLGDGTVLDSVYMSDYGTTSLLGIPNSTDVSYSSIQAGFSRLEYETWIPVELGDYSLKIKLDDANDADPSDNFDFYEVTAKVPGPDLSLGFYNYEDAFVNQEYSLGISLYNYGTTEGINANLSILDLYSYESKSGYFANSRIFEFNGTEFNVTLNSSSNESYLAGKLKFDDTILNISGYEWGDYFEVGEGLFFAIDRCYTDKCYFFIGNGTITSYTIANISTNTYKEFNFTPTVIGEHEIFVSLNVSDEVDYSNNYYNDNLEVIKPGPNLYTYLGGDYFIPVNSSTNVSLNYKNIGTAPSNCSYKVYALEEYNTSYLYCGESGTFYYNSETYYINSTNYNSTFKIFNITHNGTKYNYMLSRYQGVELPNGDYFFSDSGGSSSCYPGFGKGNFSSGRINIGPTNNYNTAIISYTPSTLGQIKLLSYANCSDDTDYSNNGAYFTSYALRPGANGEPYFYISSYTQATTLSLRLNNVGTTQIINGSLFLYENEVLIYNISGLTVDNDDTSYNYYDYIPTTLGTTTLTLVANVPDDINQSNNIYTRKSYTYQVVNRSFTTNDENGSVNDDQIINLLNDDLDNVANKSKATYYFPEDNIVILNNDTSNYLTSVEYILANTTNNLTAQTQFYENFGNKYFIYATNPDYSFNNTNWAIEHNDYLSFVHSLEGFVVYGCNDWNFSSRNCSWNYVSNDLNVYSDSFEFYDYTGKYTTFALANDTDLDSVPTDEDNCPYIFNRRQTDVDNDGQGDKCDSDADDDGINDSEDTIIGKAASINSNVALNITINGSLNINGTKNKTQLVEIKKENITIVKFNHNFSSKRLQLTNITIRVQSDTSPLGYLVIQGINLVNDTKTVTVDRIGGSNSVCVKDALVTNISEMSDDCNETYETELSCITGLEQSGYNCSINGSTFIISGLNHSALKEIALPAPTTTTTISSSSGSSSGGTGMGIAPLCLPDPQCGSWGNCFENETQYRECFDACRQKASVEKQSCTYIMPTTTTSIEPVIETPALIETCDDGYWNQDEEGIDCGGVCEPCKVFKDTIKALPIAIGLGVLLGGILAFLWVKKHSSTPAYHEKENELADFIKQAKGALHNKDIETARQMYGKIKTAYSKLPEQEKELFYDHIMEVYNRLSK